MLNKVGSISLILTCSLLYIGSKGFQRALIRYEIHD
jgi:hypothetical protein